MNAFHLIRLQHTQITLLKDKQALLIEERNLFKVENEKLKQKIAQLEDQLGLNSSNSSLPPSRDLYRQFS